VPRAKPVKRAPRTVGLASKRTHCPITKELIKYIQVGDYWIATTSIWTTRPYHFKGDLEYALSYNNGVCPTYPKPGVQVTRDAGEAPHKYPEGVTPEEQDLYK
jgi:hypothetical protein